MTTLAPSTPPARVRRSRPSRPGRRRVVPWVGCALVAVGLALLGWLGWQFWGTSWVAERHQSEVASALAERWTEGDDAATTDFGRATAVLHVPRFGDDYAVPVLEGSSDEVLSSGIGHLTGTAGPGEVGNHVLAAHRVTHGEPFADLPELRAGDLVHVETRTATYTYVLDTDGDDLVVPMTDTWVLADAPVNPDGGTAPPDSAGKRLITLVTCSEIFHTDNRSVVFGHLVERVPAADVPERLPELDPLTSAAPPRTPRSIP